MPTSVTKGSNIFPPVGDSRCHQDRGQGNVPSRALQHSTSRTDPPRRPDTGHRGHRGHSEWDVWCRDLLLVTFGLLLILEDGIRFIWGGTPMSATVIMEVLGSIRLFGARYPTYNLVIIGVGGVAAVLLWVFVYRTKFGVLLRATAQDMRMASSLGVNVKKVYVQAFALGCMMAGLGGAIIVPGQAAVLGMGTDALILAFVVVVIGGLGSLQGALIGALIVGGVRTVGIMFFPEIELAVLYLIAAVVLLVRPTGLFGTS